MRQASYTEAHRPLSFDRLFCMRICHIGSAACNTHAMQDPATTAK